MPVAIEILNDDVSDAKTGVGVRGILKGSVTIAEIDGDESSKIIRHYDVWVGVAVEIGHGHFER